MEKRYLIIITLLVCLVSCSNKKYTQIRDEEHKTFFINGMSAIDGKEKVYAGLQKYGFRMETPEEIDLTHFGGDFNYYANCYADSLTERQASRLTYGIFDNLNGITSKDVVKDNTTGKSRVFLEWYASGEVKAVTIELNPIWEYDAENKVEVDKRLTKIFPHSNVKDSKYGIKSYSDDNNVELHLSGPSLTIKKSNKSRF